MDVLDVVEPVRTKSPAEPPATGRHEPGGPSAPTRDSEYGTALRKSIDGDRRPEGQSKVDASPPDEPVSHGENDETPTEVPATAESPDVRPVEPPPGTAVVVGVSIAEGVGVVDEVELLPPPHDDEAQPPTWLKLFTEQPGANQSRSDTVEAVEVGELPTEVGPAPKVASEGPAAEIPRPPQSLAVQPTPDPAVTPSPAIEGSNESGPTGADGVAQVEAVALESPVAPKSLGTPREESPGVNESERPSRDVKPRSPSAKPQSDQQQRVPAVEVDRPVVVAPSRSAEPRHETSTNHGPANEPATPATNVRSPVTTLVPDAAVDAAPTTSTAQPAVDPVGSTSSVEAPPTPVSESPSAAERVEQVQRVANAIRTAATTGPRELRIRLHPPELGTLQVEIVNRDGGKFVARLAVESTAAHQVLSEHLPALTDHLAGRGHTVERIDVVVTEGDDRTARDVRAGRTDREADARDQSGQREQRRQRDERRRQDARDRNTNVEEEADVEN